jgi:hypothetical protein
VQGLLPPPEGRQERARPGSRSYADLQQRVAFVHWLAEHVARSGLSNKQIAKTLWPKSADEATTHQIKLYTEVRWVKNQPKVTLPAPATLRKLCELLDIPWTEAFANAGYYRELLQALADLADLGWKWYAEDRANGLLLESVRTPHVSQIGTEPVGAAFERPEFAERYIIGFWEEDPHEPPEITFNEQADADEIEYMKEWARKDAAEPPRIRTIVPKPLAVAILIATVGFPRRGDLYKDTSPAYAAEILKQSTWLIDLAQGQSKLQSLPSLLQQADDTLKSRLLTLELKRVIAAEYTTAWASKQSVLYTHTVRLGAMRRFGVAGSTESDPQLEEQLPDIRRAELPAAELFKPGAQNDTVKN